MTNLGHNDRSSKQFPLPCIAIHVFEESWNKAKTFIKYREISQSLRNHKVFSNN